MDLKKLDEERLREACSHGDFEIISSLINQGININTQNAVNGWSSLHWACKRGHNEVVKYLLAEGADPNLRNFKNETPAQLVTKEEILALFVPSASQVRPQISLADSSWHKETGSSSIPSLDFQQNGVNPFSSIDIETVTKEVNSHFANDAPTLACVTTESRATQTLPLQLEREVQTITEEDKPKKVITLKIRVAETNDPDFIEVDVPTTELSYSAVLLVCSKELAVHPHHVERIRKLPNTRLRNDRDIQRLKNLQELEFVVKGISSKMSAMEANPYQSNPTNNFKSITNFKNQTILY